MTFIKTKHLYSHFWWGNLLRIVFGISWMIFDGKQTWIWLIITNNNCCCNLPWPHQSSRGRTDAKLGLENEHWRHLLVKIITTQCVLLLKSDLMDFLVFQLFRVEILFNGRKHFVLRRYSEFQTLHRKLKKILRAPDFPSKRNQHLRTKPLEQRQQELEDYMQVELRPYMLL